MCGGGREWKSAPKGFDPTGIPGIPEPSRPSGPALCTLVQYAQHWLVVAEQETHVADKAHLARFEQAEHVAPLFQPVGGGQRRGPCRGGGGRGGALLPLRIALHLQSNRSQPITSDHKRSIDEYGSKTVPKHTLSAHEGLCDRIHWGRLRAESGKSEVSEGGRTDLDRVVFDGVDLEQFVQVVFLCWEEGEKVGSEDHGTEAALRVAAKERARAAMAVLLARQRHLVVRAEAVQRRRSKRLVAVVERHHRKLRALGQKHQRVSLAPRLAGKRLDRIDRAPELQPPQQLELVSEEQE